MNMLGGYTVGLSPAQFGENLNVTAPNFDINDTTFSDLLDKKIENINKVNEVEIDNKILNQDTPAWLNIEEMIIDNKQQSKIQELQNVDFSDFIRKNATNAYNKFSKSVVTDLAEFVEDIKGLIK